jgi:hypothetical protein
MKWGVPLFIAGLVIGSLLQRTLTPEPTPVSSKETPRDWAQKGIAQVQQNGDSAAQLKAAEEYYGKAVVLFLASLVNATRPVPEVVVTPVEEKKQVIEATPVESHAPRVGSVYGANNVKPVANPIKGTTIEEQEIQRVVQYQRAPVANRLTAEVQTIMGTFAGVYRHEAGPDKGRLDRMLMDIQFTAQDKKLMGAFAIVLSHDGEVYSRSNGDNNQQLIRLVPNKRGFIYVQPRPGSFILFDVSNPNRLRGDFYEEGGQYRGKVVLDRQ